MSTMAVFECESLGVNPSLSSQKDSWIHLGGTSWIYINEIIIKCVWNGRKIIVFQTVSAGISNYAKATEKINSKG